MYFAPRVILEVCETKKTVVEEFFRAEVLTQSHPVCTSTRSNRRFRAKRNHRFPERHHCKLASPRRGKFFTLRADRVDQRFS